MRINLGTKVVTSDGKEIGKIDRLVVDPRTERLQELVVRKGFFVEHDILIPIGAVEDRIGNDDENTLHLRLSSEEVKELPEFVETAFIAPPGEMYPLAYTDTTVGLPGAGGGLLWPAPIYEPADTAAGTTATESGPQTVIPGTMQDSLQESRPNSVFLHTGTGVEGPDGKIGTVDELVVDPTRGKVTEIIVRKGLLHNKEIRIPTQFIQEIDDNAVHVALDKNRLERFTVSITERHIYGVLHSATRVQAPLGHLTYRGGSFDILLPPIARGTMEERAGS